MDTILQNKTNFNPYLNINFQGGNLTSDSGVLLYKEFDNKIGFSKEIKANVIIEDDIDHRKHKNEDVIIQRIYQNTLGYHADNDADDLKYDEALKLVLEKEDIASQPTISRANNQISKENVKQFQSANLNLIDRVNEINSPEQIIYDLDSTNCETYGDQYGSSYNSHYGANGYHPLVMFDGVTGDFIKTELRAGNVYTSRQVVRFIGPVIKRYNKKYKKIPFYLRADSGFAKPGLYKISEEHKISYVIRLKANAKLYELAKPLEDQLAQQCQINMHKHQCIFGEFNYKAGSWDKERRVIVKIEKPKGQLTFQYSFIVTNIKEWTPEKTFKFYCKRGTMENFIKEAKHGFAIDKMNSTDFWTNANKLQQMVLAYNLNNWMRRLCFPEINLSDRISTIRTKLIKIAGKIVKTGRYIYFKLASSCPNKNLFFKVLNNIQNLDFA